MSGFSCDASNELGLFGIDVHILGFQCDDQTGAFAVVLLGTLIIKLAQNYLYAMQAQKQRELLQLSKKDRWGKSTWSSPMVSMLLLELTSTLIGILSVLVIMGANFWIFLVIIIANVAGSAYTFARMEMDHHSTATDLINMLKILDESYNVETSDQTCINVAAVKKARQAIDMLRKALRDPMPSAPAIPIKTRRGFVF